MLQLVDSELDAGDFHFDKRLALVPAKMCLQLRGVTELLLRSMTWRTQTYLIIECAQSFRADSSHGSLRSRACVPSAPGVVPVRSLTSSTQFRCIFSTA